MISGTALVLRARDAVRTGRASPAATSAPCTRVAAIVVFALLVLRILTLGLGPLLDPSESRYAEIGREMLASGDWVTPHVQPDRPFLAKPPLHSWLTAASYGVLGDSAFAARLPSYVGFVVMVAVAFLLARRWFGADVAWWSAAVLASSCLPFGTAAFVVLDALLAASLTGMLCCFAIAFEESRRRARRLWAYAAFACLGAALLIKGPVAVAIAGIALLLWAALLRDRAPLRELPWLRGAALAVAIAAPWYALAEARSPGFLHYFLWNEHVLRFLSKDYGDHYGRGHAMPHGAIWLLWILALLPWSPLVLHVLWRERLWRPRAAIAALRASPRTALLVAWAIAPMLLFTLAHNIVITYVLPALPAAAILLARTLAAGMRAGPAAPETRALARATGGPALVLLLGAAAVLPFSPGIELGWAHLASAMAIVTAVAAPWLLVPRLRSPLGMALLACLVIPAADFAYRACLAEDVGRTYCTTRILQAVAHDADLRNRPLAFFQRSYSGAFYSGGRAAVLERDEERLRGFLDEHANGLVAMRAKDVSGLAPDLAERLRVVRAVDGFVMVAEK